MKWVVAVVVLLVAAALGYAVLERQIYEQGINLNFQLAGAVGGVGLIAAVLVVLLLKKKTS